MSGQRKLRKAQQAELKKAAAEMLVIRRDLEQAYTRFDNLSDPLLLDACIFEINALRAKYNCAVHDLKKLTQLPQ